MPVSIGGMLVNPGDIVVGDADGLVAFAPGIAPALLEATLAQSAKEEAMLKQIAEGTYVGACGAPAQQVWIDTLRPESGTSAGAGFFRQSWAVQTLDLCHLSRDGTTERLHFAAGEGGIPSAGRLEELGIRLFVGVGHETTGATTHTATEITGPLD